MRKAGSYGAEKIAAVMKLRGTTTDSRTVAAIMQEMGIASNRNASYKDYKAARARYKAKLRDKAARFTEDAPNKLWVCDVSEVSFLHTKLYLSRKVMGWKTGVLTDSSETKRQTWLKRNIPQNTQRIWANSNRNGGSIPWG